MNKQGGKKNNILEEAKKKGGESWPKINLTIPFELILVNTINERRTQYHAQYEPYRIYLHL